MRRAGPVAGVELSAEGATVEAGLAGRGAPPDAAKDGEAYDGMTVEELYGQMVDTFQRGDRDGAGRGRRTWRF